AGNGVVIEYKATGGDLAASLDQLSASPGLSWVNDLRNDPALAGKVDWQAVNAEFREWDYKSQGLTEAGAALVTLVATALTAGTGITAAMSTSLTTSLGGGAAMNAALNAGLQTLINKTAVSLVNNQGDLGATLKELGSADTLRSLATAMVTAGLTTQLLHSAGLGVKLPDTAPFPDRLVQSIQQGLIRATVRAGVTTAIEGGKLDDALVAALRLEAASILGEHVAETIGAAYHGGDIGKLPQLIAHAALGCATGALASGDCTGGAVGGVVGEITASLVEDSLRHALTKGNLTQAEALVMVTEWRARGVEVARVAAGLAAALAGGDVNTGADAGGNAAENNAFFIPAIIVIISAAYATGVGDGDPLEGLAVIGRGDDPLSQAMATATTEAIEWSARHYPDQTIAVLSVLQATNNAIDATITYVDEATGKEVSTRWNRLDQRTRDQLIGGGKILQIALPAASVKMIKDLKVARNSGSGVADGVPGGPGAGGTVWDNITATAADIPGTRIPATFEVKTGSQSFWVNANATEHFGEYLTRLGASSNPITSQEMLRSFQSAVSDIAKAGPPKLGQPYNVGGWEIVFRQNPTDRLPVIVHAFPTQVR
ncbi:Possible hemagglutinin, partial [Rhizobium sp. RU33A]|uniref:DUF637 domain-containing protein n=1 Tax=Rhizobium sp. RU33A TaxID=1907413 RepID=UPI0009544AA5